MKKSWFLRSIIFAVALGILFTGCLGGIKGVRVETDYGIVDVKEDGVDAQIVVDGVEFYIEDNKLIEVNIIGLVDPEEGIEVGNATIKVIPE